MVHDNTNDAPDLRADALWLASQVRALAGRSTLDDGVFADRLRRIDAALAEPERSRPGDLPEAALAAQTIEAMRAGRPIEPEGIKALVTVAETALDARRSFGLRWEADMRAIKRWQAGDELPHCGELRPLLNEILQALRDEETPDHAGPDAPPTLADRLERQLAETAPGGRNLIWPDHADLVVWLIGLVEREPDTPSLGEVGSLQDRLAAAILKSGGNPLAKDARLMIARLAEALRFSERHRFASDTDRAQLSRDLAEAAALLRKAAESLTSDVSHHSAKADRLARDGIPQDAKGSRDWYHAKRRAEEKRALAELIEDELARLGRSGQGEAA